MSPCVATLEEFAAAVESFPAAGALEVGWSPGARQLAVRSLRRHRLCLVGEVHGVAENPLLVERLVAELGVDIVALEWPRGLELAVDDLSRLRAGPPEPGRPLHETSSDELAAGVAWSGDGRVTAGHFAVLRRTPARAVAVDEPVALAAAGARDTAMAANVEELLASARHGVLFVAGNLHTRLHTHAHYTPAGAHLAQGRPDLCALDVHYARGRFWNCGPRTFPPAAPPRVPHLHLARATEAVVLAR